MPWKTSFVLAAIFMREESISKCPRKDEQQAKPTEASVIILRSRMLERWTDCSGFFSRGGFSALARALLGIFYTLSLVSRMTHRATVRFKIVDRLTYVHASNRIRKGTLINFSWIHGGNSLLHTVNTTFPGIWTLVFCDEQRCCSCSIEFFSSRHVCRSMIAVSRG